MFDDPKLRLQELDAALKAAEAEEDMDWLQDAKDFLDTLDDTAPAAKPATLPRTKYAEEMDEDAALFVEPSKKKGAGGYAILALLELITIGLIILWWMKWTL